ncbi:hypothetical protein Acor_52610 [Acrocarpospora corrugata]|uniref:Uncharacterized protein n=1 Tax=Acrocarpospora corrugata TaxID=35763 RepID=A0A5M3W2D4_9ACTN|nr:hypothetical protein Acor_52610 [Acrocarpospora corrugata]
MAQPKRLTTPTADSTLGAPLLMGDNLNTHISAQMRELIATRPWSYKHAISLGSQPSCLVLKGFTWASYATTTAPPIETRH